MKYFRVAGIILIILILIITVLYFYARYRLSHVKDYGDLERSLDKRMQKTVDKEAGYGVVIGVYKNGRSFIKGYGTVIKGRHEPPDSNSVFELASVSKLFTTTLLQLLCDRGVVHMNDRIADLLGDKVILPAVAANTTLRQLATHTAGFPRVPQMLIDKMKDEADPYKDLKTQDLYDYLKTCAGKKPDGTFEYSNFGMGLLGHILALKTGMGYEDAIKRELLQPLGMNHTFVTVNSSNAGSIVQGYNEAGNPAPVWTDTVLTGAGSFLADAADMLLFIRANLDKHNPLYSTLAKTHSKQPGVDNALGWMSTDPLDKFMGNKNILWHNGMSGGYASYIAIDTVTGNGIILLSNKSVDVSGDGSMLMRLVNTQSWKR